MLNYINKDIITAFKEGEIKCLAHVCNRTVGMGAGIAAKLASKYSLQAEDLRVRLTDDFAEANLIVVPDGIIANIYAMIHPGKSREGDSFEDRIKLLLEGLESFRGKEWLYPVGIPLVLSGLARQKGYSHMTDLEYFKSFVAPWIEHLDLNVYYL